MKKNIAITAFLFACMSLTAQIFRPIDQMSDEDRSLHLAERFWDGFPFYDTAVLHSNEFIGPRDVFGSVNIYGGAIARYLQLIQFADLPTIQRSLAETLRRADTNERMYRHFVESFDFFLHDPISRLRNEQWAEAIWHQMLESRWVTFSDSARINFLLRQVDQNRVGSLSADLEFVTIQGQRGRLHEIEAELLMVYFYIPGCPQCRMTMEWLQGDSTLQELIHAGILTAFAFYPEHDFNLFRSYASNIPSNWINAREPDGMSQMMEDAVFQMRGAPTIYLLDRDKKVILKDARMDLLFREFERAKQRFLSE
ncbi:MAG: DUF5106 domain-containing protein [Bacteroidales bacterium]|nr:DUF5106 domain-containing protein [Bacteroidales bacterium]